jgi:DNA-binding CsgD family transcriptional regulator
MSSAKRPHDTDCTPCSSSSLLMPMASTAGATAIRRDSNTHCSIASSSGRQATGDELPAAAHCLSDHVTKPDYLSQVANIAAALAACTEQSTALTLLHRATRALGAHQSVFVSYVRHDRQLASCRFMLACDPQWCRRYLEAGCAAHDPWLAYAAHHGEPVVASALGPMHAEQQSVIDLAAQYGFQSTVLAPAHSGAGHSRVSLLLLGAPAADYFNAGGYPQFRIGARMLAMELHDWWLARIRRELVAKARITAADLSLLRHEHAGHSSKRIAADLHVSACSINSRFQRMNSKLGVANRKMAARLAAECGLIDG